jgi:hypothetical protein
MRCVDGVQSVGDSRLFAYLTRDFRPGLSHTAASRLELLIMSIALFKSKTTAGAEALMFHFADAALKRALPRFPSVVQSESSCARRTAGGGCPHTQTPC